MRYLYYLVVFGTFLGGCKNVQTNVNNNVLVERAHNFTKVDIEVLRKDSSSIRAVDVSYNGVMYAGSNGHYGYFPIESHLKTKKGDVLPSIFNEDRTGVVNYEGKLLAFRSIASTKEYFFILSIESPALLYRITKKSGEIELIYKEDHEKAFYDAMTFWNDDEGIAMGDPTENCLSVIITRDGGKSWFKVPCSDLPEIVEGEAAFAASDTNIKTIGNHTWIASGGIKSRVFYSSDRGKTWEVYDTPIVQGAPTKGAYSLDFYDRESGIIYGGDYTEPDANTNNIAVTSDGGKTWETIASGTNHGYKSCVQYVPNSDGKELVALGFTGISYSKDAGESWQELSKESFLSFRFLNDSVAYAGGRNTFARLTFR
ncbi:oxidoreductase [Dokdonia sinensis]|uniref:Oxidoreductase n=1 Tax=Dokdonia sinensis TaxID=2479847 RepID=A0A3M0G800_9FLAO|nr:oxidoreductase [Dokdonia sinensis]RMB61085.1 oxidoreductase [Dokdonia sinensis]